MYKIDRGGVQLRFGLNEFFGSNENYIKCNIAERERIIRESRRPGDASPAVQSV